MVYLQTKMVHTRPVADAEIDNRVYTFFFEEGMALSVTLSKIHKKKTKFTLHMLCTCIPAALGKFAYA